MKVAPSILSADFANLSEDIKTIVKDSDYLHIDVMDGVFVDNISIGIPVIKSIRKHFDIIFDTHLMIINPLKYVKAFKEAGSDIITFHLESNDKPEDVINAIKEQNIRCGISIRPNTPVESLNPYLSKVDLILIMSVEPGFGGQEFLDSAVDKITYLAKEKELNHYHYEIEVDGGINEHTAALVKKAGCDVVVAGSYVFKSSDRKKTILSIR